MTLVEAATRPRFFLSTVAGGAGDRRRALAAALATALVFAACAPFARVQLPQVWAFIPMYEAAAAVCDLITALLLFGQYAILRAPSVLTLAAGYIFAAMMAVAHALSFPGLFTPTGLLGAGPQTTAWLYMAWHAGFALAVVGYALLKDGKAGAAVARGGARAGILCGVGAALVATCGATLIATAGHDLLPAIMRGNRYTGAMATTIATVWALNLAALIVLWKRRPYSVLDLWLMVVMCALLANIGLAAALNAGRFDLGFYAGRIFGLLAASFVLVVMLLETGALYTRVAEERERRLQQLQQELIHVSRLNELGQTVSALAHELNQPLTAAANYLSAGRRQARAAEAAAMEQTLQKAAEQVVRASQIIERLRRFAARGEIELRSEDLATAAAEAIALVAAHAHARGTNIRVRLEPSIPPVLIDRIQIQQVLFNLVRNASEAMEQSPRRELVIDAGISEPGVVEVRVADSGPGLPGAVRDRLFQPFVSTKSTGMGVGLSICRSIVEAHGGRMWADDNPGGGTVFHFTLRCALHPEVPTPVTS